MQIAICSVLMGLLEMARLFEQVYKNKEYELPYINNVVLRLKYIAKRMNTVVMLY